MAKTSPEFLYDRRIVERNIEKGILTRDDLRRRLETLPNRESDATIVDLSKVTAPRPRPEAAPTLAATSPSAARPGAERDALGGPTGLAEAATDFDDDEDEDEEFFETPPGESSPTEDATP